MIFRLAIVVGRGHTEGRAVGFWPTRSRAVPAAPGVGRTRHPKMGAAKRRAALLVNFLTRRELANFGRWRLTFGAVR